MLPLLFWLGIGLLFFINGFRQIRLRRHILALPTSKTRSAAMGTVELTGCIRTDTPLLDPIFSQPCAYYNIEVKEKRGSGKHSHWITIYNNTTETTPFLLEDSTGLAVVLPRGAELHFSSRIFKQSYALGRLFSSEDAVSQFLSRLGSGIKTLQLTAYIFRQGDPLFVLGHIGTNISRPGSSLGHVQIRDVARELKNNPQKLHQLDTNQDGAVDPQEWEQGLKKEVARQQDLADQGRSGPAPVPVIQKNSAEQFILADSEKNLLAKFAWASWLQVFFGGGTILICALQLARRF